MNKQLADYEEVIEQLYQQERAEVEAVYQEAERVYQEGMARIEANRTRRREDLPLFLPILGKQGVHIQEESSAANGGKGFGLKKAVEDIVNEFDFKTEISQPTVYKVLEQKYPKIAPTLEKTNISKVLKQLVAKGELKTIKEAHGTSPAIYRRIKKGEEKV